VIRPWSFKSRQTVASDTKLPCVSVKLTASSRGDRSGSSRARLTIAVSILSGILFQIRRGLGLPSSRASIPPSWYRLYQSYNVHLGIRIGASVRRIESDDCSTSSMISNFSDAEYLMKRPPHPRERFFEQAVSIRTSARVSLSWRASALSLLTSSEVASRPGAPASRFLPASRNSFDQR